MTCRAETSTSTRWAALLAAALGLATILGCDPGPNREGHEPQLERLSQPDKPTLDDIPRGQHVEPDRDPAPPAEPTFPKDVENDAPKR